MFNRFRRKENQNQNVQAHAEANNIEKQQGFICPMCMAALPGPAELQAHFEKVHSDHVNGDGDNGMDNNTMDTDALPEENDDLLSNISKGSLEIALDSNAPDIEKMVVLLRQELSDINVELKEEKWYTAQLKTELEKVAAERDQLEDEKTLVEKEYMSQLRSAEEGYFEIAEENKKLKEDLVFSDYNSTKDRHDKLKQQTVDFQNKADVEGKRSEMLEEELKVLREKMAIFEHESNESKQHGSVLQEGNKTLQEENNTLREQVALYQSEMEEDRLRLEGLQTGITILKKEICDHQAKATDEKKKRKATEKENIALKEVEKLMKEEKQKGAVIEIEFMELRSEREEVETELHKVRALLEEEVEKTTSQNIQINGLQEDLNKERGKMNIIEKEHAEQLTKMEEGDQGTVIQELSLEKAKFLESIASMESLMALKLREHSGELVNIRQEKMAVMVELRESQLEIGKLSDQLERSKKAKEDADHQNEKLKLNVKTKEEDIAKVTLELEESENENKRIKERLEEGNDEKEIIMNELRKSQEEVKGVETVVKEREEEITASKEELSSLNAKVKNYEVSNANLNGLVNQKDTTINEMKVKHSEAVTLMESQKESEKNTLESEVQSIKKENERITDQLETSTQEVDSCQEEIEELGAKVVECEVNINTLENRLEVKEEHLLDALSKLEVAENELKKDCESCKNYEVQLCRLQEETKDSQGKIATLQKDIENVCTESHEVKKELNATITHLTQEKLLLEESAKVSLLKIQDMDKIVDGLNTEKEMFIDSALQAEEKMSKLDEEMSNLEDTLTNLKVELLSENAEKDEARKELEKKEGSWIDERNVLLQHAEDLNANIQKITSEFSIEEEKWVEEKANLTEQLTKETEYRQSTKENYGKVESALRVDIANLQRKLETGKEEHERTMKSKEQVQTNLTNTKKEFTNYAKQITDLQAKVKSVDHDKNELKGDVNVLEVQLQSANEEKSALLERVLSTEEEHKKTKQKLNEGNRKLEQALSALQELGQENQNIQVQQVLKSNRQWLKDNECDACKKCDKFFSFTVRKHHCRHCGFIFCSECSCYSAVVASHKKAVRVCEGCSMELSTLRGSNVRRLSNASSISSVSTR